MIECMLIGSISYTVENIQCAGPVFQMEHIFYGYSGLRAINFVIVSSAPTSGSKSQVSIYFCYPKSTEIKPGISEDLQEMKCLGERRSPWTKHQGGSLHSRAAKNQEMYQQTPPHQSLQNVVTVYMLINSFHRKLCPPRINHQGQRRERHSEKTGLLTGSGSLGSFGSRGFPSLSYAGGQKHGIESFHVYPTYAPCKHYKRSTGYTWWYCTLQIWFIISGNRSSHQEISSD